MHGVWTVDEVRAAERAVIERTGAAVLMRRAAFGVAVETAAVLTEHTGGVSGRRAVLLVGSGDNGGDALWAGAFLRRRGVSVTAVLLHPERAHADGLAALRRAGGRVVPLDEGGSGGRIDSADSTDSTDSADPGGPAGSADSAGPGGPGGSGDSGSGHGSAGDSSAQGGAVTDGVRRALAALRRADVVVDGIVGLSGQGPLRPDAAALVAAAAAARVPVVAVDLPSGVDPDTGAVDGPHVTATATVTFGARKPAHVLAPHTCGRVRLVDIGIGGALPTPSIEVLDAADVATLWPLPGPADDKYTQGVTGVAAGSSTYPGAAVLATGAAVLATSGMVRYAGAAADGVRARWPEVVATGSIADAGRVQSWVVGPGLGAASDGRAAVRHALGSGVPVIADADAITLLANHPDLWDARDPDVPVVLTPHDREFARIAGDVGSDRVAAARRGAADLRVTLLLKGHATVIADPDGTVVVHPSTASWAATAGSGDVLSGLVGALLASGLEPILAAAAAVHVHEAAAVLAAHGGAAGVAPVPASALLAAVPAAIRAVLA